MLNILRRNNFKLLALQRGFSTINVPDGRIYFPFAFSSTIDILKRVDPNFQTDRNLSTDILKNKDHHRAVKKIYLQFLRGMVSKNPAKELSSIIEKRLLANIMNAMEELKEHSLTVELYPSLPEKDEEALANIEVGLLGALKVRNIEIEREKNAFIHQYIITREEDQLIYERKKENKEAIPITKTEKMQKEMLESFAKKEELSGWRSHVKTVAEKLGFPTEEKDFAVPNPLQAYKDMRYSLFQKNVEGKEYILVEDYEVTSPYGLIVKDANKKPVTENSESGNIIRHFLRVEKKHDSREAPSIWKAKPFLLTDVDFFVRGNPHVLVKNYAK